MNRHEKPKQLNLKDGETYELAAELAKLRGESLSGAVKLALREALQREQRGPTKEERLARIMAITGQYAKAIGPRTMTDEEVIGYGEFGEPI
jgi:hypothetical protein